MWNWGAAAPCPNTANCSATASIIDNLLFNYLTPRITCIAQPVQELSLVAVKLLIKKMSGESGVSRSFLPPDIVIRDSVRAI